MYDTLDFICIGYAKLWKRGSKQKKNQNETKWLKRDSNQQPSAIKTGPLDRSATLTDDGMRWKVLHHHGIWIKSTRNVTISIWFWFDVCKGL